MGDKENKRIGILVGREWDWPEAFMAAVNGRQANVTVELVKLGGTFMDTDIPYDLIIDRMSHEIPYYRAFLQYAASKGCYIINNPFTWSADNRFFATIMANRLGLRTPKTVALPNKEIERDVVPESFRNLTYPMDWQGIIDYVGVPAIFKDVRSGGRRQVYRVHTVNELIQRFDESGTQTMILQELIESDIHIHGFVIGQKDVLLLQYDHDNGRYFPGILSTKTTRNQFLTKASLDLTTAFGYDMNMVEFVIKGDQPYVINSTNPAPVIDRSLMSSEQFDWLVQQMVELTVVRVQRPLPQFTKNMFGNQD
ncbi:MAG: hypothetical protein R3E31_24315 [Chloroflexota bacterium]|nr:hypothetical protein [Anaerolineales bacterium]MCA9977844.1 hypothetical protein [Anaerolineales bacterium]MCB8968625.1 hypothetical protein [Ardenticatenaceae bacterium]